LSDGETACGRLMDGWTDGQTDNIYD